MVSQGGLRAASGQVRSGNWPTSDLEVLLVNRSQELLPGLLDSVKAVERLGPLS